MAPDALRECLLTPVPSELYSGPGSRQCRLCDLDETVWQRFSGEQIAKLARLVVQRVAAYNVRRDFEHRPMPQVPEGARLADLPLENRTRRCLIREGLHEDPAALGRHTIGSILDLRSFGPRCLVDLLCTLEASQSAGRPRRADVSATSTLDPGLTAAAERLSELSLAEQVRSSDPRFGDMLRAVDLKAATAAELATRILRRRRDPPDPSQVADQVDHLTAAIALMPRLTLEEELTRIFAPMPHERNGQILISYYGWNNGRPRTLTEVGTQFSITRERVRQICGKLVRRHEAIAAIPAPVMDRTLALILPQLPIGVGGLETQLAEQGLTAVGLPLRSVIVGAKLLGRSPGFEITRLGPGDQSSHALAVRAKQVDAALDVVDLAKKEIYFHGLATVGKIRSLLKQRHSARVTNDLVREALQRIDGFRWLDGRKEWFRLVPQSRHGLPKMVEKILAVAGEVTIGQMRTAIARNRRFWKDPPPEHVLLEFCRHTPGIRIEGQRVIADPPLDWRQVLTGVEAQLVEVLKAHGPVMDRGRMEDLCTARGMNRFSFHAFVSWSPVIAQVDHSVYSLLGAEAPRQEVDKLVTARRAKRLSHRVLDSHGWTLDGKVWLSYRLSKAASTYAVITVPAALKDVVQGSFALLDENHRNIGLLATRDGRAWGLGAFLRKNRARIGDQVVVTLDLRQRTAQVEIREDAAP